MDLGFERIDALLDLLGNPERDLRAVQVVGTNGKGTTAVALAAALEARGHPSGAYLSPHVLSYVERVVIRGKCVSEDDFAAAMSAVIHLADKYGVPATQFELLTAGALAMFREAGLSWAVLEAGLGARHDATTAAKPGFIILTNVALDHTEYLGETVEEIAREKLASLRAGSTLILGTGDPEVVTIARQECARVGARLVEMPDKETSLPGATNLPPYAAADVLLGIRAAEVLLGENLDEEAWHRAGKAVVGALPARFEAYEVGKVPVVVDGGHNVAGLSAAVGAMTSLYGERPLGVVFGALKDKDLASMLSALKSEAHFLVLTRPAGERAAEPGWVGREFGPTDRGGRRARVVVDAVEALGVAVGEMREVGGVVLVTGSLYTGAAVLGWLREA